MLTVKIYQGEDRFHLLINEDVYSISIEETRPIKIWAYRWPTECSRKGLTKEVSKKKVERACGLSFEQVLKVLLAKNLKEGAEVYLKEKDMKNVKDNRTLKVNTAAEVIEVLNHYMENGDTVLECSVSKNSVHLFMDPGCDEAVSTDVKPSQLVKDYNNWIARYEKEVFALLDSEEFRNFPQDEYDELMEFKKGWEEEHKDKWWGSSKDGGPDNKRERLGHLEDVKRSIDYPLSHEGVEAYVEQFLNEAYKWKEAYVDEEGNECDPDDEGEC